MSRSKFKPNSDDRLMDQVLEVLHYYHYAYKTEQSYCSWILQFVKFYGGATHPKDMGKNEVERFLRYLAEKSISLESLNPSFRSTLLEMIQKHFPPLNSPADNDVSLNALSTATI